MSKYLVERHVRPFGDVAERVETDSFATALVAWVEMTEREGVTLLTGDDVDGAPDSPSYAKKGLTPDEDEVLSWL